MSSARYEYNGQPFRQGRYVSRSVERPVLSANWVAERVELMSDRETRKLVWFAQWVSMRQGVEYDNLEGSSAGRYSIWDACVNPSEKLYEDDLDLLRSVRARTVADARARHTETAVGKQIREMLDYTLKARILTAIIGPSRLGKTHAARSWCDQNPGIGRLVQCPPSNDDWGWYRSIAAALGVEINLKSKAFELRERLLQVLHGGDICLVFDECNYLFGQNNRRFPRPHRLNFLMSELVNYKVPVALIGLPSFWSEIENARVRGWQGEQFIGRIQESEPLPVELTIEDLETVAHALLPSVSRECIARLAEYAASSQKRIASIESAATRAKYMAEEAGRSEPTDADVRAAVRTSVMPSDGAMVEALSGRPARPARGRSIAIAAPLQAPDRGSADPASEPANRINFAPQTNTVAG